MILRRFVLDVLSGPRLPYPPTVRPLTEDCSVAPTPCPAVDGSSPSRTSFDEPPPMCIDPSKRYTATMQTSMGTMKIALDPSSAPVTVNNFVVLARYHYFDGIIFHRIINGFMCQGGDPTGTGTGGPGYRFADELPSPGRYEVGSLAMANAGPDTNGSQFFVVSGPSGAGLPPQYSLFGKVVAGLDVVEAMQNVETNRSDRPLVDVTIESVTIEELD
jgi:cyclophilin family peptidyl-prolyl cis-trans isomerase